MTDIQSGIGSLRVDDLNVSGCRYGVSGLFRGLPRGVNRDRRAWKPEVRATALNLSGGKPSDAFVAAEVP